MFFPSTRRSTRSSHLRDARWVGHVETLEQRQLLAGDLILDPPMACDIDAPHVSFQTAGTTMLISDPTVGRTRAKPRGDDEQQRQLLEKDLRRVDEALDYLEFHPEEIARYGREELDLATEDEVLPLLHQQRSGNLQQLRQLKEGSSKPALPAKPPAAAATPSVSRLPQTPQGQPQINLKLGVKRRPAPTPPAPQVDLPLGEPLPTPQTPQPGPLRHVEALKQAYPRSGTETDHGTRRVHLRLGESARPYGEATDPRFRLVRARERRLMWEEQRQAATDERRIRTLDRYLEEVARETEEALRDLEAAHPLRHTPVRRVPRDVKTGRLKINLRLGAAFAGDRPTIPVDGTPVDGAPVDGAKAGDPPATPTDRPQKEVTPPSQGETPR